jgi:hypothetical protein
MREEEELNVMERTGLGRNHKNAWRGGGGGGARKDGICVKWSGVSKSSSL